MCPPPKRCRQSLSPIHTAVNASISIASKCEELSVSKSRPLYPCPDLTRRAATSLRGHFQTWLACRFGEEHAFPNEVWLLPNPRDEPPSDPRGVIRIARKLYLKNSILRDSAVEQKRQAEDHNERGSEPRSECGSACCYNQNPGGVSGVADEGVGW